MPTKTKSKFYPKRRTIPFLCLGHTHPHLSKGMAETIRGEGPYCGNCAGKFLNIPVDEITGLPMTP